MKQFSKNFKKLFLLYFTRELILHSGEEEFLQLQNSMAKPVQEEKELREFIHSIKTKTPEKKEELIEEDLDFSKIFKSMRSRVYPQRRTLLIPETKLPEHLQYLKPIPRNIEIDLEKLNPLIKDPAIKIIECNGPDEHIIVRGKMGVRPTNIVLGNEEINKIIKTFSQVSHIPFHEGVYHVVAGRLILSAIISQVVGSKFMIKKMLYTPNFKGQTYPQPMIR